MVVMSTKKTPPKSRAKVSDKPKQIKRTAKRQRTDPQVVDLTQDSPTESNTHMNPLESDDYFVVLGLARSASAADVKKAYRKLAVQWHPDKNRSNPRAEEFFKKISEAYEVLSDPDKRQLYESSGKTGVQQGASPAGADYSDHFGFTGRTHFSTQHARDIFDAFFGGADPFESFFGGQRRSQRHGRSMFDEDWDQSFGSMGFGGMRGFGSMGTDSFFSDGFDMGGGFSTSMSSSSSTFTDRNGHVVTQKTTTTTGADGRTETVTEEYRNGKLVNSTSSSTTSRLAGAGRMQLQRSGSKERLSSQNSQTVQRRGSRTKY